MSDFLILDEEQDSWNGNNVNKNKDEWSNLSLQQKIDNYLLSIQSVKIKNKVVFYRLLSTMTDAWMTLIKSIMVLEKQEKNPVLKTILNVFIKELKQWKNLSECLDMYPSSFSEAEIWIIKSWEKTWKLNSVLVELADQIEKVEWISWKIKSALMYPAFIMIVVVWVIIVMMTMVVPKLLDIFEDKSSLPASTQLLMAISNAFRDYWFLMLIVLIGFIIFVSFWKKTSSWRYKFDEIMLKVPVFWIITKKLILSKFARTFSGLSSSGVSVVESLKITAKAVGNEVYKQRLILLSQDIASWIKIYESLEWDKLFPEMMVQMIQVWEQTARLDKTILKVAEFYDQEVDNTIWVINKLLEPFIIVTLAVVVWFIAVAIMQPIMNLADTVSNG